MINQARAGAIRHSGLFLGLQAYAGSSHHSVFSLGMQAGGVFTPQRSFRCISTKQAGRQAERLPPQRSPVRYFSAVLILIERACGAVLHGRVTAELVVSLQFGMRALISNGGAAFRGGGPVVPCARWNQSLGR